MVTGENTCMAIANDPRCSIERPGDLHESLVRAMAPMPTDPSSSAALELKTLRHKICECSCYSSIVETYTPMFHQWAEYETTITDGLAVLRTMCSTDVVAALNPKVAESSSAQCAQNTISVSMTAAMRAVPVASVFTITGLNGDLNKIEEAVHSNVAIGNVAWVPADCTEWCSKSGLCPSSGSAVDDSCKAVPTMADGKVTSNRCIRWCDKDAVLEITLAAEVAEGASIVFDIMLQNPTYTQRAPTVQVSASGPGFYSAPTNAVLFDAPNGILAATDGPAFVVFETTLATGACESKGVYDAGAHVWRGNCAGMRESLNVTIQPNVVLKPGARITLDGLIRSGNTTWPAPSVREDVPGFFKDFAIESWEPTGGVLVLRVTAGEGAAEIPAGAVTRFALDADLPSTADGAAGSGARKSLSISASRGGTRLLCAVLPKLWQPVLLAKLPAAKTFVKNAIAQTTCFPGECNTIKVLTLNP